MKFNLIIVLLAAMATVTSCYEDKDIVEDITTPGRGAFPVSANTLSDLTNGGAFSTSREYATGTTISFEVIYWSDVPIKEINMYSTLGTTEKTRVYSEPYSEIKAFSKIKSADTLVLKYVMPSVAESTPIRIDVDIVNDNTLTLTRFFTVKVKP